jgi:hypothetical protein
MALRNDFSPEKPGNPGNARIRLRRGTVRAGDIQASKGNAPPVERAPDRDRNSPSLWRSTPLGAISVARQEPLE